MSDASRELGTLRLLHELMCRVNAGEDLQTVLQSLVDGVADVAGFRIAAVSILHPNQEFEMLAVAGDDDARRDLLGNRTPLEEIAGEFAIAENWGVLRFIPHERLAGDPQGWIPQVTPLDVADAWHPEDALLAPLHAPTGEMVGLLSVDLPVDGLRPGQFARDVLDMYAVQAGIAISNAKQRDAAREEIRLATVVHDVARAVNGALSPSEVVEAAVEPVAHGLHCDAVWVRIFDAPGGAVGHGLRAALEPSDLGSTDEVVGLASRVACEAWAARQAVVLAGQRPLWEAPGVDGTNPLLRPEVGADDLHLAGRWLDRAGCHSVMLVPIGAGPDCCGYLLLGQATQTATWQASEVEAALEIGREIGRALLRAQVYDELRELDRYKTEMFGTVAHELKSPLTAISGHVELLEHSGSHSDETSASLAAIDRASGRLAALVEDLLVLARVSDPHRHLVSGPVDLQKVAVAAQELVSAQAAKQGVTVGLEGFEECPTVVGDATELDRMVGNLLTNAVKFSPDGGRVTLAVEQREGAIVLRCTDEGLGISQADQEQLFTEFFRSSAPAALQIPGTGLGLAIVKRIVDRHAGTITVESAPGAGATFTVVLPTAAEQHAEV